MPDQSTPGEVAYEAWWRARWPLDTPPHFAPYDALSHADQRAWEAAAQAVLADARGHARALVQHWHAWHRDAQAPALPLLTAMHALETWLAQQEEDAP